PRSLPPRHGRHRPGAGPGRAGGGAASGDGRRAARRPPAHARVRRRSTGNPRLAMAGVTSRAPRSGPRDVLVLNAGSSTLKGSVLRSGREKPLAAETVAWDGDPVQLAGKTLAGLADRLASSTSCIAAVGHRVVHGGTELRSP